jgi:hypothetical protein
MSRASDALIGDALIRAIDPTEFPDHVFLVDTSTAAWALFVLVSDRKFSAHSRYEIHEFERDDLPDLIVAR